MKNVHDLQVSDFPGVDPVRFDEWKAALALASKAANLFSWPVGLMIIGAIWPDLRSILLPIFLLLTFGLFALLVRRVLRVRRLQRELGITNAAVRAARKRQND